MADFYRMDAPGAFHNRGGHDRGKTRAIKGRGHGEQPQIRPQHGLRIQAERKRQISFQRAFMDFIQDDGGNTIQSRIAEQAADEEPRRHHLDARDGRNGAFQPRAKADRLPDLFANQACHAAGRGTGGQPARFEHKDAAAVHRRRTQQRKRHAGCLARAGRRDQHGIGLGAKNRKQARKTFRYWQVRQGEMRHGMIRTGARKTHLYTTRRTRFSYPSPA